MEKHIKKWKELKNREKRVQLNLEEKVVAREIIILKQRELEEEKVKIENLIKQNEETLKLALIKIIEEKNDLIAQITKIDSEKYRLKQQTKDKLDLESIESDSNEE